MPAAFSIPVIGTTRTRDTFTAYFSRTNGQPGLFSTHVGATEAQAHDEAARYAGLGPKRMYNIEAIVRTKITEEIVEVLPFKEPPKRGGLRR